MTEICDRVLRQGGPAILFEKRADTRCRCWQPLRHAAPRGAGHGAGKPGGAARGRPDAGLPEGTRAAEGHQGRLGKTAHAQAGARWRPRCAPRRRARRCVGGQGRRSRASADPALLARRRGAADHLGADHHARPEQAAPEPRHLPPAGAGAEQTDHALAGAPRRRLDFRDHCQKFPRPAVSRSRWCSAPIRRPSSAP